MSKRKFSLLVLCVIPLGVILCLVTSLQTRSDSPEVVLLEVQVGTQVDAQADTGYSTILDDGFDGGSTVLWESQAGWEAAQEGGDWYYEGTPNSEAALVSALIRADYRFRTDLRIVDGWASLHYRKSQSEYHHYRLEVEPGQLVLSKYDGDVWTADLISGTAPIFTDTWHTVEISGTRGHIQVFVDEALYLDYDDPDPVYAGSVVLAVLDDESAHVDFDNVQILVPTSNEPAWVQTNGPSGGQIGPIEVDPSQPNTVYAGGRGGSIFKTTDGGATWKIQQRFVSPYELVGDILVSPTDPQTVYALANRLFKSTDGGTSWRHVTQYQLKCVAMDPANSSALVVGTPDGKVYHSTDGGDNWTNITSDDLPGDAIEDVAFGASGEFWAGTANGSNGRLYHTTNGGTSWTEMAIGQQADTDIHTIFVDPDDTDIVYVGLIDIHGEMFFAETDSYLLKTENGGATWTPLHLPATDVQIDIAGKASVDGTLYVLSGKYVSRSSDGGQTWSEISVDAHGQQGDLLDIAVDPLNGDVLYLPGTNGIAKSTDGGVSWTRINEGLLNVGVSLLALPDVPGSRVVYASTIGGEGTFKTTDNGNTWTDVSSGGLTHPWADELMISPHDTNTVWYVADLAMVFVTVNGGDTWTKTIDAGLSGFRFGSVYAVAPAPSDPGTVYALKNGWGIFKTVAADKPWGFLHQSEVDYTYSIAVHPTVSDTVYSGYTPKPFQDWAMVRQTIDGGISWTTTLSIPHSSGVTAVVIDPNRPDTVYAGSAGEGGEVWVTHNAGDDWANINERFNFTNIHVMAADPSDPDTAYAGVWGGGTFKTTDGGQSWSRLPDDPTISASAILIDPLDSDVIYLADRTSPRIYRTTDGGATWEFFFNAGSGYYRVLSAALAPSDPNVLYASIFTHGGPMAGDVFRIDTGLSITVTGSLPRLPVALTVDPTHADTVYAALHGYGVYKTTDGGQTWSDISGAGSGLPQSPHVGFNGLVVDPDNTDVLYLIGGCDVDVDFSHTGATPSAMNTVYKSVDGGATWTNLDDGTLGAGSSSIKGLTIAPSDSNVLYAGALKGVFRSTDGGTSWDDVSTGLGYTHTAGVALSSDGAHLYAPMLGGGVYASDVNTSTHGVTWTATSHLTATIHNVQIAVHPTVSQTLYASAYPGGIFKSTDGGSTWGECNFGMASFEIDDPTRQGYYAFAIAPSDPDVLYLGLYGVGMYKSTDGAGTWRPMNGSAQEMRGKAITSLLIDPSDDDLVYVATENGVFRSTDGGVTWTDFNTGLDCTDIRVLAMGGDGTLYAGSRGYELYIYESGTWQQMRAFGNFGTKWPIWNDRPLYQYTSLLFHPTDPDLIYVGTFPAGVYTSTNGGQSWRESNVGWTNDGVFSLVFHPDDTDIIYAGTYNGVNRSTDGGAHWEMWDQGWPDEQWAFSIEFDPRDPNVMYACSKNGENEGTGTEDFQGTVMKSVTGGASWFPITTGLNTNQEFYKIVVDKLDPNVLYLATELEGVFISRDNGALWLPWNEGLTAIVGGTNGNNVTNILEQSADGHYIYFGSGGSGVFRRPSVAVDFVYLPLVVRGSQ